VRCCILISNLIAGDEGGNAACNELDNRVGRIFERAKLIEIGNLETFDGLCGLELHRTATESLLFGPDSTIAVFLPTAKHCLRIG
jgi:hypothetical protein